MILEANACPHQLPAIGDGFGKQVRGMIDASAIALKERQDICLNTLADTGVHEKQGH
jgi:hypothetical protein